MPGSPMKRCAPRRELRDSLLLVLAYSSWRGAPRATQVQGKDSKRFSRPPKRSAWEIQEIGGLIDWTINLGEVRFGPSARRQTIEVRSCQAHHEIERLRVSSCRCHRKDLSIIT